MNVITLDEEKICNGHRGMLLVFDDITMITQK